MKFVLNKCWGGFSVSDFVVERLGLEDHYPEMNNELTEQLVQLIEEYGSEKCSGSSAKLRVVEIPDTYTDIEWDEFDGIERITYVVDGKIYHA